MGLNNKRAPYIYLAVILILGMIVFQAITGDMAAKPVEYNEVISLFEENKIAEYTLDFNTRELTYTLFEERDKAKEEKREAK